MDAVSTKPRTRRSMRVATIFTGVAACTAGVTHVAHAQDIRPAPRVGPGSIRSVTSCAHRGIDHEWLHVSTVSNTTVLGEALTTWVSDCFGYFGTFLYPRGTGISGECGGNNSGYLWGSNGAGGTWGRQFFQGTGYARFHEPHLSSVSIFGWKGTDTCGQAPNWGKQVAG